MADYRYGDPLSGQAKGITQQFVDKAREGYDEDMANVQADASRELAMEMAGLDTQGQMAGYQTRLQEQDFENEADRFDSGLSFVGARLGDELMQRERGRTWDVQDRDYRIAKLRKEAQEKRDKLREERNRGFWNNVWKTGGKLVGGAVGTYFGGPMGGAAGAQAGEGWGNLFSHAGDF